VFSNGDVETINELSHLVVRGEFLVLENTSQIHRETLRTFVKANVRSWEAIE
jgi:hypothetical protein